MYNPGISEKQWRKLMAFLARMNEKYGAKLAKKLLVQMDEKKSA